MNPAAAQSGNRNSLVAEHSDLLDVLVEPIARRVVELLREEGLASARMVDAAELAELLGVDRGWVYEHADELGAERLGDQGEGRRPRLRFDVERARRAWSARSEGERSHAPSGRSTPGERRGRRRASTGASVDLLPIRGQEVSSRG